MLSAFVRSFTLSILFLGCTGEEELKESTPETPSFSFIDPVALIGGMTLDESGADWARWMLERTVTNHPAMDTTGAHCEEGQGEDVFYLAGTFGGTPTDQLVSEEDLRAGIDEVLDALSLAEFSIDGKLIGDSPEDFAEYRTTVTA